MKTPSKRVKKTKTGQNEKSLELPSNVGNEIDLNEALMIASSVIGNMTNKYQCSNVEIVQALVVRKLCVGSVEREMRTRNMCSITHEQLASLIADCLQRNNV
jgi:hypothetical protein